MTFANYIPGLFICFLFPSNITGLDHPLIDPSRFTAGEPSIKHFNLSGFYIYAFMVLTQECGMVLFWDNNRHLPGRVLMVYMYSLII